MKRYGRAPFNAQDGERKGEWRDLVIRHPPVTESEPAKLSLFG